MPDEKMNQVIIQFERQIKLVFQQVNCTAWFCLTDINMSYNCWILMREGFILFHIYPFSLPRSASIITLFRDEV